jgi:hypothetical protein
MPDADRLDPAAIAQSARLILARCENDDDRLQLVIRMIREVRVACEREEAIRSGYEHARKMQDEMHDAEIEGLRRDLVNRIRREAKRGTEHAPRQQQITYEGGLRRAARIVEGGLFPWHR